MKTVVIIYAAAILSLIGAVWMANDCINANLSAVEPYMVYTGNTGVALVIPDSGYNSPTDALQTVSAINLYQTAKYEVQ